MLRIWALIPLTLVVAAVSACTVTPPPATSSASATSATRDATMREETTADGGDIPSDLSFDAALPARVGVTWAVTAMPHDTFLATDADDSDGRRAFTDTETGCDVIIYQGPAGVTTQDDERAATRALLGRWLSIDIADVTARAFEVPALRGGGEEGTFDALLIDSALSDGRAALSLGRVFRDLDAVVMADVSCPAGVDTLTELVAVQHGHLSLAFVPM